MNAKEFIESKKIWEIIEEITKIETTFKKEGYCNLPGLTELLFAIEELILLRGYQAEDIQKIATEAAVTKLGMKKLNNWFQEAQYGWSTTSEILWDIKFKN